MSNKAPPAGIQVCERFHERLAEKSLGALTVLLFEDGGFGAYVSGQPVAAELLQGLFESMGVEFDRRLREFGKAKGITVGEVFDLGPVEPPSSPFRGNDGTSER